MNRNQGFIQVIIIIILSVVILSLLGVSLRSFLTDQTLWENFAFLGELIKTAWNNYGAHYVQTLWEKVRGGDTRQ